MITSLKVKDNSNIGFIIVPFCLFPLVFMGIAMGFNISYLITFVIMFVLYTAYMVLILKILRKQEDVYAIKANEEELTLLKLGTFKWEEINAIKAVDENSIFTRHPQYFIAVFLKNGKKLNINVTNFDYQCKELATILTSLGKLGT